MIQLRVLELLEERNLSKYWLYCRLGLSYKNFDNMVKNRTKSIRFENIEKMCFFLDCTPNDLFEITPDEDTGTY